MRFLSFLTVLTLVLVSFVDVSDARTGRNYPWSSNDWAAQDFKPYFGDEQIRQRSLWDDDHWTPEAWIVDAGDEKRVMRSLYGAGIITKQYKDSDNIPVLEVGENYVLLSRFDQIRVLEFVDYVFQITTSEENGMFFIAYKPQKGEQLGIYTKHGYQSY